MGSDWAGRIIVAVGIAATLLACADEPLPQPIEQRYLTVAAAEADDTSPAHARWIYVIDVSEPGGSGAQALVAEAEELFRRIEAAPTGAIGVFESFDDRVFVHDFARAPLEPAHELDELPVARRSDYVFAPDNSGLIVRSELGADERGRLDYVALTADGIATAVELQLPPSRWASEAVGFTLDGDWIVVVADDEANEPSGVYAFAIDDGRPSAPITVVEPGVRRLSPALNIVGEHALIELYDTSWDDPESHSTIMRVDISALPTVELELVNQPVPRSGVSYWVLGGGARLIHYYEPNPDDIGQFELIEIDEDGPAPPQLLTLPDEHLLARDASADGRWAAFRSNPGFDQTTLYLFDFEDDTPTEPSVLEGLPGSLELDLDLGWMSWHDNYETSWAPITTELLTPQLFRSGPPWHPGGVQFDAHTGRVTLVEIYQDPGLRSWTYKRFWTRSADGGELGPLWRIRKPSWFEPHEQWPVFVPGDDRHFVATADEGSTIVWESDRDGNERILFEHTGAAELALWSP